MKPVPCTLDKFITVWEAKLLRNIWERHQLMFQISDMDAKNVEFIANSIADRIAQHYQGSYPEDLKDIVEKFRLELIRVSKKMSHGIYKFPYGDTLKDALEQLEKALEYGGSV